MQFSYEYTDTFSGEANYSWVKRGTVSVPELTHYGYDGSRGYIPKNLPRIPHLLLTEGGSILF